MKTAEQLDVLLQFYMKNRSTMEPASLRSLISCLTSLLLSLECSKDMWSRDAVKKSFLLLLSFCIHDNGKIRRTSQDELMKIVESQLEYPGGIIRKEPIVNVLMLNLALDERK